jgi:hypothetical protein
MPFHPVPRYTIVRKPASLSAEQTVEDVIYFENRYSLRGPDTQFAAIYYETELASGELTLQDGDSVFISIKFTHA